MNGDLNQATDERIAALVDPVVSRLHQDINNLTKRVDIAEENLRQVIEGSDTNPPTPPIDPQPNPDPVPPLKPMQVVELSPGKSDWWQPVTRRSAYRFHGISRNPGRGRGFEWGEQTTGYSINQCIFEGMYNCGNVAGSGHSITSTIFRDMSWNGDGGQSGACHLWMANGSDLLVKNCVFANQSTFGLESHIHWGYAAKLFDGSNPGDEFRRPVWEGNLLYGHVRDPIQLGYGGDIIGNIIGPSDNDAKRDYESFIARPGGRFVNNVIFSHEDNDCFFFHGWGSKYPAEDKPDWELREYSGNIILPASSFDRDRAQHLAYETDPANLPDAIEAWRQELIK